MRQLKKHHEPSIHGNKFWSSSYLIMDYLGYQGLPIGARVLEAGCGWGLAGIFCAKQFGARVTGIDADEEVFPYLDLHAEVNGVEVQTRQARFEEMKAEELVGYDVLLAADVCFWDEMVDPLYGLIEKAVQAGVQQVVLADPGRPPFVQVSERCSEKLGGQTKEWSVEGTAATASGSLMIIGTLPRKRR
jgi:2-polyprenyl-3-methyl-5-hydroxy-6-metoxy-1,4-benzoquinol methylase